METINWHIIQRLQNKKIALLGLGIENLALARFWLKHFPRANITVCDIRSAQQLGDKFQEFSSRLKCQLGPNPKWKLEKFDVLFRSPGWSLRCPFLRQAAKKNPNLIITSPIRLFFQMVNRNQIVGVTGTKGKGTTASLIAHILKEAGKTVWLGGNIGVAPFSFIENIEPTDWIILELSSFQLEDIRMSPHLAVWTNFFPEHLSAADPQNPNFHPSLQAYWSAKANLIRWQGKNDLAIINRSLRAAIQNLKLSSQIFYFGRSRLKSQLIGAHNQENIAAAALTAQKLGIPPQQIKEGVASFKGLTFRLELVAKKNGRLFYNDSFATTPEAAQTALAAFQQPIILIAGGTDKGADYLPLAQKISQKTKQLILLPGSASLKLKKALCGSGFGAIYETTSLRQAVKLAWKLSSPGDVILLSPAAASFGIFKNYKTRGLAFNRVVKQL